MHTLEGTVLIQSSRNFVRMLILIKSRSCLKLDHVGSKTWSLGPILEKPCVHTGHSFDSKFRSDLKLDHVGSKKIMKLCQNVDHHCNYLDQV